MIGALALVAFAMALNVNVVGSLAPFLGEDPMYAGFDEPAMRAAIGWLLAAGGFASAAAALLLGPMVDRFGRRAPMLGGGALFVLASLGHVLAGSHEALLVARAAAGFGVGLVFTSASAAVADLVRYERRAAAMGTFGAGIYLAIPVGLPLAVLLGSAGAWRAVFVVQAVVGFLALAGVAGCVPGALGRSGRRPTQWEVLRAPMVLPALASVILHTGAFFTVVQFVPYWLAAPRPEGGPILARDQQVWLWVGLGLCSAVGSFWLPRLADRLGKRTFVLITSAGLSICVLLMTRVRDLEGLLTVGVPLALLASARTGPFQALVSQIVPTRLRGTLMGIRAAAVSVGTGVFPALGGKLFAGDPDPARGFTRVLWVAFVALVVSYLVVRNWVREPRVRPAEERG